MAAGAGRGGHLLHSPGTDRSAATGRRRLEQRRRRARFSVIDFRLKPHAGRWESGSLNVAGISALGASLELLLEIGIVTVAARIFELTDHLCEPA